MTQKCLNHRNLTYDICRHCNGKMLDCPEYLSEYEHSPLEVKPSNSVDKDTSDNGTKLETNIHTRQITIDVLKGEKTQTPLSVELRASHAENYSRPVVLLQNVRSKVEPMIARPDFLERFRRYQR